MRGGVVGRQGRGQPRVGGGQLAQRLQHEVLRRVDRLGDAEDIGGREQQALGGAGGVGVGGAVVGGAAGAVELGGGGGHEVGRFGLGPALDRGRRNVGRRQEHGEQN